MSRRKQKQVTKANRRLWASYLQALVNGGDLNREEVFVYDHVQGPTHVTAPNALAWETPKDQKRPNGEPCEKCKRCTHCGQHHDAVEKQPVTINGRLWSKIHALMTHFDKHEWLGVLTADADGIFTDMEIPKQEVTGGTVQKVDHTILPVDFKIDGVIHSHVSMGAFHSGVDDENLITNYPVSVVVSKKDRMEFEAVRTVSQECGGIHRYKTSVLVELEPQDMWLEGVVGRVSVAVPFVREVTPTFTTPGTSGEPWLPINRGKQYCPMGMCYREREHEGEHWNRDRCKDEWYKAHPETKRPTILCQRTTWCLRDTGHSGACSDVRDDEMCRLAGYCVRRNKHEGSCSAVSTRIYSAHTQEPPKQAWWQGGRKD